LYSAFVRFNPIEYIKQMKCPVLALNGEWDVQVNARQNLDALKTVYPDAEIKTYSGVNHMFQEASSLGQSLNYGAISQTFSPKVLDDIAKWMVKITAKK
ncbi:MAG: dienelactone hydrolase family protein, partial [Muribaculaceae bacterium]|nr:dienelactone hydrolase family protein [Muribaculaceae bacterium]